MLSDTTQQQVTCTAWHCSVAWPACRSTLAAAAQVILPGGGGPGADEANAIAIVDWLAAQEWFERGLGTLERTSLILNGLAFESTGHRFDECSPQDAVSVIEMFARSESRECRRLFRQLVNVTIAGFLCSPAYGGNRQRVGWQLVGLQQLESDSADTSQVTR
jgi:gluconate 2-dehydrogenase gamma chain